MKKTLVLGFLFLWVGCCNPMENWNISEGQIILKSNGNELVGTIDEFVDKVNLHYTASIDYVINLGSQPFNFGQALMAFQCDDGFDGILDPIASFFCYM